MPFEVTEPVCGHIRYADAWHGPAGRNLPERCDWSQIELAGGERQGSPRWYELRVARLIHQTRLPDACGCPAHDPQYKPMLNDNRKKPKRVDLISMCVH